MRRMGKNCWNNKSWKKYGGIWVLVLSLMFSMLLPVAAKASVSCSDLNDAVYATKASGLKKMKASKTCTFLSYSNRKKVDDFAYASDSKQIYVVCIVKAGSSSDAKKIKSQFDSNKKDAVNNSYISSAERKIAKSARYGSKGNYVWYLSLGSSSANKKAEKAVKKLL